jgi:hypothetical protein
MVKSARREYLETIRKRYRKAWDETRSRSWMSFVPIVAITANMLFVS